MFLCCNKIPLVVTAFGPDETIVSLHDLYKWNLIPHRRGYQITPFSVSLLPGFIPVIVTLLSSSIPETSPSKTPPRGHRRVQPSPRSRSDHSVFYCCSFKGYQDTLYAHSGNQFYRECDIYGTNDFIFGDAAAVFQNCNILIRRPMHGRGNVVKAQGRGDPNRATGFSFHDSKVMAAPDLKPVQGSFKTYLGRPWNMYSRTIFMKCTLEDLTA
ncbi:hypothetical protein Taro_034367 [Colocasia esculenta]|uniref:Pectinesterase catalytic domain-containing protein n=1 Tax=Colocasia esculenta TaxID=4460 RepID=A0A843W7E5_COLES|nr:hypothetical protein [Colocasia esculenta]